MGECSREGRSHIETESVSRGMGTLTRRQLELLRFIVAYWKQEGCAPTFREMGDALGVKPPAMWELVEEIARKGYVRRSRARAVRGIEVLHDPDSPAVCPLCGHEREPAA